MVDLAWLAERFPRLSGLQRLDQGGQKEVFKAIDPELGTVVLKVFKLGSDPQRAVREVRASRDLAVTQVPRTLDVGTVESPVGDLLWIVEECVPGVSLRSILAERVLTDVELISLARGLLDVLAVAESAGIVHRDVKPDNVLLAGDGSFWLIDFGLVRYLELSSLTASESPFGVGTPGYAPPEQFRNIKDEIDGRADLFGLGVTLYEAAEGVNPLTYGARDRLEVLNRTELCPLPRLARDVASVDGFPDLVAAMVSPRRTHRPASVAYARRWLEDLLTAGV